MKFRTLVACAAFAVLVPALTACGAATPTPRPAPSLAPPTVQPTVAPTMTPSPTSPPSPTPTQTPIPVQATAKQDVNTRKGPGLEYAVAAKMTKDTKASVLGKNQDGKWLQIAFPDAANPSWSSATFLNVTGPLDSLQVIQIAPVATSTRGAPAPTKVTVAPTQAVPPPHGGIGFVYFENESSSIVQGNITVDSHATSGFQKLGPRPGPFDIRNSSSAPPFAVSPDNTQLAFVYSPDGKQDVLKMVKRTASEDPKSLVGHQCISSPTWENNKFLLYIGMDDKECTTQKIYKIAFDGSSKETFGSNFPRPGESIRGVAWGPFVLFVSNLSGAQEIWRLNQDGSAPTQVTDDKRENGSPSWSPDGTRFAYYSKQADGSFQIMVRNADGSNPRKLTSQGHNFTPAFSQDGNWIAFMSDRGGRADIYIMDRNGGQVRLLTDKFAAGGSFPGSWR